VNFQKNPTVRKVNLELKAKQHLSFTHKVAGPIQWNHF